MDKVYQIFVSSTYSDLQDQRQQVSDTLAKAGFIPAGMELFPAADQQQLEFIKRIIDRSDYYVVIVGGRYGSLADDRLSYTEKEYEYAIERNIPILAFIHKFPEKIESGKVESDPQQLARLEAFRNRLKSSRLVAFWTETGELCTKVLTAAMQATNLKPGIGWVRGDQAIDPKVLQESERLRIEVAQLRKQLNDLNLEDVHFPSHLAGPEDEFEFVLHVAYKNETQHDKTDRTEVAKIVAPLGDIFIRIFDSLLADPSEYQLRSIIGTALSARLSLAEARVEFGVTQDEVTRLRYHFEALGLIQAIGALRQSSLANRMFSRNYIAWTITEKGRRYVTHANAILKPTA